MPLSTLFQTLKDHLNADLAAIVTECKRIEDAYAAIEPPPGTTEPPPGQIRHGADVPASGLVGLRSGVSLKSQGDLTVTNAWLDQNAPGNVVRGLQFSGTQIRPGNGVRPFAIEDCLFLGAPKGGGFVVTHVDHLGYKAPHIQVRNCSFDGKGNLGSQLSALGPGPGLDLHRIDLKGHHQGVNVVGDANITECYMHDMALKPGSGAHGQCILWPFGANVNIERNWLIDTCQGDSTTGVSGALTIYNEEWNGAVPDGEQPHDGRIIDNVFEGGSYATYGGATNKATPWCFNLTWTGNRYYRTVLRWGHNTNEPNPACTFATTAQGGRNNVWSNNTWGPLGPRNQPGDPAEGTVIPSPGGWGSPH